MQVTPSKARACLEIVVYRVTAIQAGSPKPLFLTAAILTSGV